MKCHAVWLAVLAISACSQDDVVPAITHQQAEGDEGPACPSTQPADGEDCAFPADKECYYASIACDEVHTATCVDGDWSLDKEYCNPMPYSCPEERPTDGAACDAQDFDYPCVYSTLLGCNAATTVEYICSVDGAWFRSVEPGCGADLGACATFTTSDTCPSETCAWLEPGCGVDALDQARCVPAFECSADECELLQLGTCQSVAIDATSFGLGCDYPIQICL